MSIKAIKWAFDAPRSLSPSAKLVLLALAYHADDNGKSCYPSLDTLQTKTNLARATVVSALKELKAADLIEVKRSRVNRYELAVRSSAVELPGSSTIELPNAPTKASGSPATELWEVQPLNFKSSAAELNPSLTVSTTVKAAARAREDCVEKKATRTHHPAQPPTATANRSQPKPNGAANPPTNSSGADDPIVLGMVHSAALAHDGRWNKNHAALNSWFRDGITISTIVEAIRTVSTRASYRGPPQSLVYFDKPIRELHATNTYAQPFNNGWGPSNVSGGF
jgi:Helix-turn-helix domain